MYFEDFQTSTKTTCLAELIMLDSLMNLHHLTVAVLTLQVCVSLL